MQAEAAGTPIHLNVRDVALAAKKAFEEQRLSAQTTRNLASCFYRDRRGSPCAIGAALSDDQAAALDRRIETLSDGSIAGAWADGLVTTDRIGGLTLLQVRHDTWATAHGRADRAAARQAFLDTLNSILGEA